MEVIMNFEDPANNMQLIAGHTSTEGCIVIAIRDKIGGQVGVELTKEQVKMFKAAMDFLFSTIDDWEIGE